MRRIALCIVVASVCCGFVGGCDAQPNPDESVKKPDDGRPPDPALTRDLSADTTHTEPVVTSAITPPILPLGSRDNDDPVGSDQIFSDLPLQSSSSDVLPPLSADPPLPLSADVSTDVLSDTPSDDQPIRIATFNIQVFGVAKMASPGVPAVLVDVARRFDVLAIQEIRSVDQSILPRFVAMINQDGSRYDFVLGERLGRSMSKEQYAFVFDTERIVLDPDSIHTVRDPHDLLHREPLVARFRARTAPGDMSPGFTFTLVNIHTDPDEVAEELDVLDDLLISVRQYTGEDDVILLGDLNASPNRFRQLGHLPDITWVVSGEPTNTRGTECYDNLLFDRHATTEYTGYWGIVDLMTEFSLDRDQALAVSDHLPVWATFARYEQSPRTDVAARPGENQPE